MKDKNVPVWIQMLTPDEFLLELWEKQGSKAARPRVSKYGWAKQKVSKFLALQGSNEETKAFGIVVPADYFGRTKNQIYKSLWMAINKYFYDDPVRVKVYDDSPDIVWLERTDR